MTMRPDLDNQRRLGLVGWALVIFTLGSLAWAMALDGTLRTTFG